MPRAISAKGAEQRYLGGVLTMCRDDEVVAEGSLINLLGPGSTLAVKDKDGQTYPILGGERLSFVVVDGKRESGEAKVTFSARPNFYE